MSMWQRENYGQINNQVTTYIHLFTAYVYRVCNYIHWLRALVPLKLDAALYDANELSSFMTELTKSVATKEEREGRQVIAGSSILSIKISDYLSQHLRRPSSWKKKRKRRKKQKRTQQTTRSYNKILYDTIHRPDYTLLHFSVLYYDTTLDYTILYDIILYYTIPLYTILEARKDAGSQRMGCWKGYHL